MDLSTLALACVVGLAAGLGIHIALARFPSIGWFLSGLVLAAFCWTVAGALGIQAIEETSVYSDFSVLGLFVPILIPIPSILFVSRRWYKKQRSLDPD